MHDMRQHVFLKEYHGTIEPYESENDGKSDGIPWNKS